MSDHRFNDRLKRIQHRARSGAQPDILAGVGDVKQAREAARRAPFPLWSMVLGSVTGFAALWHVLQQLGLAGVSALARAPDQALALAQDNPGLGAAGASLALIGVAFVLVLTLRRRGARVHAFAFTGVAGALAALAFSLADPDRLVALITQYTAQLPV